MKRHSFQLMAAFFFLFASSDAFAQKKYDPGATDTEIKIGQNAPFSGPASSYSILSRVQSAYVKAVNERGGINGRKITLLARDDGYSPAKSLEVVRQLVEDDQVLLTSGSVGTPTNTAIWRYMNEKKVPATVDNPDIYLGARGGAFVAPAEQDWLDAYAEKLQTAKSPLGLLNRNRLPLAAE